MFEMVIPGCIGVSLGCIWGRVLGVLGASPGLI